MKLTRRVIKVMGIFSGLQMLGILCSVVKMKLVAIWLGTAGVGLFGIYQAVVDTISTFTDMGIRQSAVRDVAEQKDHPSRLAQIATVVRRWSLMAGLLGAVVICALALPLGHWFFGSASGAWGFVALAAALFLNSVAGGEQALLQGSGRLKALASANLWGTLAGLAVSIPMFYWCGDRSVVMSIIAYAVTICAAMYLSRLRTPGTAGQPIGLGEVWAKGRGFAKLGLYMALAAFITSMAHTVFIGLLNEFSSTQGVGLVQAGDTIVVRYMGLIFTAIGMEFYPRMAANQHHPSRQRIFVNHEITLLLLVLTPLLILFMLLREPVVQILYTREFMSIIPFISLAALSSIPKAESWCMANTIISRGDGRIYILTEGLDALISVPLCLGAYLCGGLAALGAAYIAWYLIYALLVGLVYYRRYRLALSRTVWLTAAASLAASAASLGAVAYLPPLASVPLSLLLLLPFLPPLRRLLRR